jgi:hypothetical protein
MVVVRFTVAFHGERGDLRAECHYTSAYVQRPSEAVNRP